MLVKARFSLLGPGLQSRALVGNAFFMPINNQNLRYVTMHGFVYAKKTAGPPFGSTLRKKCLSPSGEV